jgi:hypothetical protein
MTKAGKIRWVSLVLSLGVGACGTSSGGTQVEVGEPIAVEQKGDEVPVGTLDFEAQALEGIVFEPIALEVPEMPGNGTVVKRSLADQKKRAAKKGAAGVKEKYDYALLLWYTVPESGGKKAIRAQREEALKVLTEIAGAGKPSEEILWAYAAAEHAVGDRAKAVGAWDKVIATYGSSANAPRWKALRDVIDLQARAPLTHPLPDTLDGAPYEAAYVAAWVHFRGGNAEGARAAIAQAAKGWTNLDTLPQIRRDFMIISARTGAAVPETMAILQELVARDKGDWLKVGRPLADAYAYAGEYGKSIEVLDALHQGAPPASQAEFRATQALSYYRLMQPGKAADALLEAWAKVGEAGDAASPELKELVGKRIGDFGVIFHAEYSKTRDERFAEPAKKLYAAYVTLGRQDSAKVKDELLPNLEATIKQYTDPAAPKAFGELDKDLAKRHVGLYLEQVGACYEAALQGDPNLTVQQSLEFQVAADGKVTEAKAGDDAVGKCLAERARAWLFPATGVKIKVTYPFSFAPRKS